MCWRMHKKHLIVILLECVSYDVNEVGSSQTHVYIVLDQVKPDIVLTSSKADESFIDAVSDHGASDLQTNVVICDLFVKFTSGFCYGYISNSSIQRVHGIQGTRQALVSQSLDELFRRR